MGQCNGRQELLELLVIEVLLALAEADGKVVTRGALIEPCWRGVVVGHTAINRVIRQIRRLAETLCVGAFAIETLPRVTCRGGDRPVSRVTWPVLWHAIGAGREWCCNLWP